MAKTIFDLQVKMFVQIDIFLLYMHVLYTGTLDYTTSVTIACDNI